MRSSVLAHPDLERRLREHPGDLAAWYAYADRLQEQGDARGELIRLQQRLACARSGERAFLEREISELVRHHRPTWDAALPPGVTVRTRRYGFPEKVAVQWSDEAPALIEQALGDRFVTGLAIGPPARRGDDDADFDEGREAVLEAAEAAALATLDLGRLTELDLSYFRVGDVGARALAASIAKGRIQTLDLRYCGIGDDGLGVLAASPHFDELRRLRLQSNALTAEGMYHLKRFQRLPELDLRYNRIGADGVDALLDAPFIGSLERLFLHRADISDAGVRKLASASQLPPALRSYWRNA
jgi:uncharacterized protein (TIGR02996 family)